jgi:hypothetical protein
VCGPAGTAGALDCGADEPGAGRDHVLGAGHELRELVLHCAPGPLGMGENSAGRLAGRTKGFRWECTASGRCRRELRAWACRIWAKLVVKS